MSNISLSQQASALARTISALRSDPRLHERSRRCRPAELELEIAHLEAALATIQWIKHHHERFVQMAKTGGTLQ